MRLLPEVTLSIALSPFSSLSNSLTLPPLSLPAYPSHAPSDDGHPWAELALRDEVIANDFIRSVVSDAAGDVTQKGESGAPIEAAEAFGSDDLARAVDRSAVFLRAGGLALDLKGGDLDEGWKRKQVEMKLSKLRKERIVL